MMTIRDKLHKKTHTTLTLLVYTTKQCYVGTNISVHNTNNDAYDITINVAHKKKQENQ